MHETTKTHPITDQNDQIVTVAPMQAKNYTPFQTKCLNKRAYTRPKTQKVKKLRSCHDQPKAKTSIF